MSNIRVRFLIFCEGLAFPEPFYRGVAFFGRIRAFCYRLLPEKIQFFFLGCLVFSNGVLFRFGNIWGRLRWLLKCCRRWRVHFGSWTRMAHGMFQVICQFYIETTQSCFLVQPKFFWFFTKSVDFKPVLR